MLSNTLAKRKSRLNPEVREREKLYHKKRNSLYNERQKKKRRDLSQWPRFALANIRSRAKKKGLEFNITPLDIPVPTYCPILGIKLEAGTGSGGHVDTSPSVDRIDPKLGYISGNVRVISYRANRLKCDATVEEMRLILEDMENLQ